MNEPSDLQLPPVRIRLKCLVPVGESRLPGMGQDEEGHYIEVPAERAPQLEEIGNMAAASGRRFAEAFGL